MRFSKTVHAVLSGLMRSSAHSSTGPLYFSPFSDHLKHRTFSNNGAENISSFFQKVRYGR